MIPRPIVILNIVFIMRFTFSSGAARPVRPAGFPVRRPDGPVPSGVETAARVFGGPTKAAVLFGFDSKNTANQMLKNG